jgi:hypothetical protein
MNSVINITTCEAWSDTDINNVCGGVATSLMFDCCDNTFGMLICDTCNPVDNSATSYCDIWFESLN